jgi:hypothetical protein
VPALEDGERERPARQRLQVGVRQQPPDQGVVEAELGRVPVRLGEPAHRVEHGLERLGHRGFGQAAAAARPPDPRREHVRHRVLLGERQHDLARQPAEQERLHLGRAHPQRPPEVLVAAVVDDAVGAVAGRPAVRQVLRLVRGEELGGEHGPPVLAPGLPPRGGGGQGVAAVRRQGPDPGPDERVVGGEGLADRRVGGRVGHGERRLQHVPGLPGVDLAERVLALGAALAARLAAVVEQLADPRGHPAVADHPFRVVVHHGDQRVRFLPGVAEHADDLVLVAEVVGVDVALGRGYRAQVLRPAGAGHPGLDQLEGRALGLGRLPGRAETGDAGEQGEGRRAALAACVVDQPLADELLDRGGASPAATLTPPRAKQLTDHELGIEWAAHSE